MEKKPGGSPLVYQQHHVALARQQSALGLVNREIGEIIGVTERTIRKWMSVYPDFGEAIREGRAKAAAAAAAGTLPPRKRSKKQRPRITRIVVRIV